MDAAEILERLNVSGELPVEAIRAASANRAEMAPIFVAQIEAYLASGATAVALDAVFFMVYMLAEWREHSAYRPLARLLHRPVDDISDVIGYDAATEYTQRIMAAVFDGDPEPLYAVIRDPLADEYVRARMCEVVGMVARFGALPRAEAARFLGAFYAEMMPQDPQPSYVWVGWESAIAMLGLAELKPLVEEVFARGLIARMWMRFEDFEKDLQQAIDDPSAPPFGGENEYTLFGDTITELSTWYGFRPKTVKNNEVDRSWPFTPVVNPHRNVGRNDPCPCGSGKKFKKCCLQNAQSAA